MARTKQTCRKAWFGKAPVVPRMMNQNREKTGMNKEQEQ